MKQDLLFMNLIFLLLIVIQLAECEFYLSREFRGLSKASFNNPAEKRLDLSSNLISLRVRNRHILDRRRMSFQKGFRDRQSGLPIDQFNSCRILDNSFYSNRNFPLKDFRNSRYEMADINDMSSKENRKMISNRKVNRYDDYSSLKPETRNLENNREATLVNRMKRNRLNNRSLLINGKSQNRDIRLAGKPDDERINSGKRTNIQRNSNPNRSRRMNDNIRQETIDSRIRNLSRQGRINTQNTARVSTERNFFKINRFNLVRDNRKSPKSLFVDLQSRVKSEKSNRRAESSKRIPVREIERRREVTGIRTKRGLGTSFFRIRESRSVDINIRQKSPLVNLQFRENSGKRNAANENGRRILQGETERRREGVLFRSRRAIKTPVFSRIIGNNLERIKGNFGKSLLINLNSRKHSEKRQADAEIYRRIFQGEAQRSRKVGTARLREGLKDSRFFRASTDNFMRENQNTRKLSNINLVSKENTRIGSLIRLVETERRRESIMLRSKRELKIPNHKTQRIRIKKVDLVEPRNSFHIDQNIEQTIIQNRNGRGFRGRIHKLSSERETARRESRDQRLLGNVLQPVDYQVKNRRNSQNMLRTIQTLRREIRRINSRERSLKPVSFNFDAENINFEFVHQRNLLHEHRTYESKIYRKTLDNLVSLSRSGRTRRMNSILEPTRFTRNQKHNNRGQSFREDAEFRFRVERLQNARSIKFRFSPLKEGKILTENNCSPSLSRSRSDVRDSTRFSKENNRLQLARNNFLLADNYRNFNIERKNRRRRVSIPKEEPIRFEYVRNLKHELKNENNVRNIVGVQTEDNKRRLQNRRNLFDRNQCRKIDGNKRILDNGRQIFVSRNRRLYDVEKQNNVETIRRQSIRKIRFFRSTNIFHASDSNPLQQTRSRILNRRTTSVISSVPMISTMELSNNREIRSRNVLQRNNENIHRSEVKSTRVYPFSLSFSVKQDNENEFSSHKNLPTSQNNRVRNMVREDTSRTRRRVEIRNSVLGMKTLTDTRKQIQSRKNSLFLGKLNFQNELSRRQTVSSHQEHNSRTGVLNAHRRDPIISSQPIINLNKGPNKEIFTGATNDMSSIRNTWYDSKQFSQRRSEAFSTVMDVILGLIIIAAVTQDSEKGPLSHIRTQFNQLYISSVSWIVKA